MPRILQRVIGSVGDILDSVTTHHTDTHTLMYALMDNLEMQIDAVSLQHVSELGKETSCMYLLDVQVYLLKWPASVYSISYPMLVW